MAVYTPQLLHIVALGSSFAAGPGISPQIDLSAGRSGNNYAHILASGIGADITDLTVSGATLNNILFEPQLIGETTFEPQTNGIPPDADIVTVTGGGNDMGYIGGLMTDALIGTSMSSTLSSMFPTPNLEPATAEETTERFIEVIDTIREKAPKSKIILVEYLCLLGLETRLGIDVNLTEEQFQHHQYVAEQLSTVYKLAAEARPDCMLIPVHEKSRDHCLGSNEPWVEGISSDILWQGNPFHPNLQGMQAVADMIYERMTSDET